MKNTCKNQLPALIVVFALLILWQMGAMHMNAAYILPSPTQILQKLWELRVPLFTAHLPATIAGNGHRSGHLHCLGLALAILMDGIPGSLARHLPHPSSPRQTIPTTALAPLFVLWFGYSIWSKVLVTVLITFFPITITVYDGLRSVRVEMIELLETYGASRIQIFRKLKLPATLPYFFSALKMAFPCPSWARRSANGWAHRPVWATSAAA